MSPMKWVLLNILIQSSIFQSISFLNMKKNFKVNHNNYKILTNKMNWKW